MKRVDVEIVAKETIKPTSSTDLPRTYTLSCLDQIAVDAYIPFVLFLPNNNTSRGGIITDDVVSKRSKLLKETLPAILSRFYPFVGKLKDNVVIEGNSEGGVFYVEARVKQTLEEFLCHPDDDKIRELLPEKPHINESWMGNNYAIGVQVNIFGCGGIGLSMVLSHKIIDFQTYMIFMKAWAAAVKGEPETISPSFVASDVFPSDPNLLLSHKPRKSSQLFSTKRFVFDSTVLAILKSQPVANNTSRGPTRMEATTALIWKAAAKASSEVKAFNQQSPYVMLSVVNIRKRSSPPLPENSIGNLFTPAVALCFPTSKPDLPTLIGELRDSIAKENSEKIESMKGENGLKMIKESFKHQMDAISETEYVMVTTSVLNMGIYDLDFGWGKPVWFYYINPSMTSRLLVLIDTPQGDVGVEAIVTLTSDEMEIFQCDTELLSYATLNPCPL
uniref:stemmadenine O-acetyltransferase-like isoform X1 n=1 Tax=Erigeron canadensis TaxID=72917 RepID=UPI001CB9B59D|nr:stemmadenine O-acetyltransferase-like isoform X1 [Erigeron canadensis]